MSINKDETTNDTVPSLAADWRQLVQRLIKAEMSKRGTKYQDLSDRLSNIGIHQSADNLRNKINKGIMGGRFVVTNHVCLEYAQD